VDAALERLLELRSPSTGYWFMDTRKADYYRGILHSAQPLIALATFAAALPRLTSYTGCWTTTPPTFRC
jgi:hypothetical protein